MQSLSSLSAEEAAALLGVKPQTLYAYASRGLVRRSGTGKRRRYLVEDLERLQLRQRARSGHGPVAAAALSFGEPVLDTRITGIDERGPLYRGRPAVVLAERGHGFEEVAELLWTGELPRTVPIWAALPGAARLRSPSLSSLEDLLLALPGLVKLATERHLRTGDVELRLGRQLLKTVAQLLAGPRARRTPCAIAELLVARCSAVDARRARAALDLALVLLADHELNASSFAARVAASTDASLLSCLQAALATLTGPRHGGACDRVEALLAEAEKLAQPGRVIEERNRRGEAVPGFGHPLYRQGDPRARPLLERARALARGSRASRQRVTAALIVARAMERQGLPPTVDFGLVALTRALGMAPGSAALLFALGRGAGWIAHVIEQRSSEAVLRPRARYLGA